MWNLGIQGLPCESLEDAGTLTDRGLVFTVGSSQADSSR